MKETVNVKTVSNEKRCSQCYSLIARGKRHKCNKTSLIENLVESASRLNSSKLKEHVVSELIKSVSQEKNSFSDQKNNERDVSISISQNRGKSLTATLHPFEKKHSVISSKSLQKLQTDLNLSKRKVLDVAKFIISETKDKKIMEKNFKSKLDDASHSLDDLFEARAFDFIRKQGDKVEECKKTAVLCNDVPSLIYHVIGSRNHTNVHIKIGVDGGGGFLKVTLSIQTYYEETVENILSSRKSNRRQTFKDSGVKKIFIIFLAPSTQENYTNISIIWESLKLNEILGTISTDLKLANILTGSMISSSTHPCT